jgi:hypothetical protein
MTAPFTAPMKFGQDEPLRFEGEIIDLELIEGEIPADLEGLLTQAVPEYLYPPVTKALFPMDMGAGGDGMVRAFRFGGGKVDFATKFVKTERTTANTGINFHNGVLLAAKEDGLSYMVDALTLETIGKYDANGAITSKTLSAHVRMDPKTGGRDHRNAGTRGASRAGDTGAGRSLGRVRHCHRRAPQSLSRGIRCVICARPDCAVLCAVVPIATDAQRQVIDPKWPVDRTDSS